MAPVVLYHLCWCASRRVTTRLFASDVRVSGRIQLTEPVQVGLGSSQTLCSHISTWSLAVPNGRVLTMYTSVCQDRTQLELVSVTTRTGM